MLIEFRVSNYRSFRQLAVLSMVPSKLTAATPEVDRNNVVELDERTRLLRSCVLFGANASGKSNLVRALEAMKQMVFHSAQGQQGDRLPVQPFRLNTDSEGKPSGFEVLFVHEGRRYRYGFEATASEVVREWLYHTPTRREAKLFEREGQEFSLSGKFREGRGLEAKTRPNALFLSVCAQFNGPISTEVLGFFRSLHTLQGASIESSAGGFTASQVHQNTKLASAIRQLVGALDLGIRDVQAEELELSDKDKERQRSILKALGVANLPEHIPVLQVRTVHDVRDPDGKVVGQCSFDLGGEESEGTRKAFAAAGPLLDTLLRGWVLVVDELDAQMHPLMMQAFVDLFHDPRTNPRGAQLLMTTHNVTLLDQDRFRRDQIWIVEKNKLEESELFSLAEFKGVRKDMALDINYLRGKFGGVPYLGGVVEEVARVIRQVQQKERDKEAEG